MRETLYDRFRPFKPYDWALAVSMMLLLTVNGQGSTLHVALLGVAAAFLFLTLDSFQRLVPVPTPAWQSWLIVVVNTVAVTGLVHVPGGHELDLAFYMLHVGFATVAFGEHLGIGAAVLSLASRVQVDFLTGLQPRPALECVLLLAVLFAVVALLARINRLQQDALFDAVTDLRNHRYFQVRLREELERAERSGVPVSLVLFDLDDFKKVNDRFGHAVGDRVLRQVSRVLVRNARSADVVCRYGGEELAVILPATDAAGARDVAERLRRAVEEAGLEKGPPVTTSAGVATCPEHAVRSDGLIAGADAALYRAKHAGKNRVEVAESTAEGITAT